jgi:hypothetical protein
MAERALSKSFFCTQTSRAGGKSPKLRSILAMARQQVGVDEMQTQAD